MILGRCSKAQPCLRWRLLVHSIEARDNSNSQSRDSQDTDDGVEDQVRVVSRSIYLEFVSKVVKDLKSTETKRIAPSIQEQTTRSTDSSEKRSNMAGGRLERWKMSH